MRVPTYLSYSAFSLFEKQPDEFYLRYLAEHRPPRVQQEHPAAVGSAFDAYVKSALHTALGGSDLKYSFEALFEAQVEPQNRDWARIDGAYVFDCYKMSGFYDDLLKLLQQSSVPPRFEFTVEATIEGVPLLCKPDARWVTPGSIAVIHDFKVNGYCSKYATSPHKSFMLCRDGFVGKQTRSHNTEHNAFLAYQHGDLSINTSYLEAAHPQWADQLTLYGWSLDEKIGDENVVLSVHQIVAKPAQPQPQLRIASYRARVSQEYQLKLADRLKRCWNSITTGHVFQDLSREDSDARCAMLEDTAIGLHTDGSTTEDYFATATRDQYRG